MRISLLISAAALTLTVSSCTTIQQTSSSAPVDTQVCNLTVADMKVSEEKAEKTVDWAWNPLTTFSLAEQKKSATAELLKDVDADVLVEPQYIVNRRGVFRGGSVTVTGYPATYSNFRNMTKEEMELAAAADRCAPGEQCTVTVNPVVQTSASYRYDEPREAKEQPLSRQFVSVTFGGVLDTDDQFDTADAYNFGIMYGSYGRKWGWYGRISISTVLAGTRIWDPNDRFSYYGDSRLYVPNFTIGFIKTINKNFNYLMGIGLGGAFKENDNYYEYWHNEKKECDTKSVFSVPLELGFQYRTHAFNLLAGTTVGICGNPNVMPFIGLGYSF